MSGIINSILKENSSNSDLLKITKAKITHLSFYKWDENTIIAEEVLYDKGFVENGKQCLCVQLEESSTKEKSTLFIGGSNIEAILKDFNASPLNLKPILGKEVYAYKDLANLYGIFYMH